MFCGSSAGRRPAYREAARTVGRALARRGCRLVYGGARVGLMGALADAALEAGGEVLGVIPEHLLAKELGHPGVGELEVVADMHQRKARMAALADAFVALPGGIGTLEELFEVLTWAQLGLHGKPVGLLDVGGFYDGLRGFLQTVVAEGFLRPAAVADLVVRCDPEELLDELLGEGAAG